MVVGTRWIACCGCLLVLCAGCSQSASSDGAVGNGESGGALGFETAGWSGAASGAGSADAANGGTAALAGGADSAGAGGNAAGGLSAAGSAGSSGGGSGNVGGNGGVGAVPFKGVANSPCAARTALNVAWYYNWEQKETEACSDGKGGAFVPMIWGHAGAEQTASTIQSLISGFVKQNYPYVLGFNEPDNASQSNLPVATAISLLKSFGNPSIHVGTPATQANSAGQAWFKDYMAQVAANASLRDDFIALHWYGWDAGSCDASASQLESYIEYAEGFPGNRPIWLTEWACLNLSAPTADGVLAFYKGALVVFARHPRVQRYAWYPWTTNCQLNDQAGNLTALGLAYAAAPATKR